jgi:hypothetical protein
MKGSCARSGLGFACVPMRSNSGPIANIAYTTVRSIFDTVTDGDVICSSPRIPPNAGARGFFGPLRMFSLQVIAR